MRFIQIVLIILILLGIVFAVGPRVDIDTTIHPRQLPQDLDSYLAESEAQFSDITPGAEKTIVWLNSATKTTTPISLVYVHGFSATRQEVAPLGDLVATQLNANLFYTRLTGHGRSDDALGEATVNDWLNDTAEAIAIGEQIGDGVVIMATSTGATLVTWMAANGHLSDKVRALVLVSPNFSPAAGTTEILLWPWGEQITRSVVGPYVEGEPINDGHAQFWTTRYPVSALLPMMGSVKILRDSDLSTVTQPLLMLHSNTDVIINIDDVKQAFEEIDSTPKALVAVETEDVRGHVLAGNIRSPDTTEPIAQQIINFLNPILNPEE
ncbi:MAG: alpha/beta fold hydrolase [Chloroflexota bacterium]